MNALLIYPEWPDTYWSFRHALPFQGKRSANPPLGLLTIAALLPTDWAKRLVDTNVRPLKDSDLAWADVALVSGMLVQKDNLLVIVNRCRAHGVRTVVGGTYRQRLRRIASLRRSHRRWRGRGTDRSTLPKSSNAAQRSRCTKPLKSRQWIGARCPT
jgi:hypothetical protein